MNITNALSWYRVSLWPVSQHPVGRALHYVVEHTTFFELSPIIEGTTEKVYKSYTTFSETNS